MNDEYKSDMINSLDIYVIILDFLSFVELSTLVQTNHNSFNVRYLYEKEAFYSEVRFIMIANNYGFIVFLHLPFNAYGFTE